VTSLVSSSTPVGTASDTARVLVLTGPRQLEYIEVNVPEPGPGEILVRSIASGISHGTEMNVYRGVAPQWRRTYDRQLRLFQPVEESEAILPERGYYTPSDTHWGYPLAYGYANVGRVVAVGDGVASVAVGSIVFGYQPHQTMYVAPATSVVVLPHDISDPIHGVLYASLNTAYNGVLDADVRIDDTVVVFGQGVVGLLVTSYLRRMQGRRIITVDGLAPRRRLSLEIGADEVLDPASDDVAIEVRQRTSGRGADVTIEVSGSYHALQEAIRTAAPDTTVVAMSWYGGTGEALALSDEFHHNRITIKSSQVGGVDPALSATHSLPRRMRHVLDSFDYLDLESLISSRIPFEDAARGYELIDSRDPNVTQVVLTYPE
jgi:threonine dehydrogenase-like Zn-dependent dehydrogenase